MTTIEIEQKISDAFRGGEIAARELRLSTEEADYIRATLSATLSAMGNHWYEVRLPA